MLQIAYLLLQVRWVFQFGETLATSPRSGEVCDNSKPNTIAASAIEKTSLTKIQCLWKFPLKSHTFIRLQNITKFDAKCCNDVAEFFRIYLCSHGFRLTWMPLNNIYIYISGCYTASNTRFVELKFFIFVCGNAGAHYR